MANNVGSRYVRLHVAKSLTGFKLCTTTPNNRLRNNIQQGVQTDATSKSNNVGSCWPTCCVGLHGASDSNVPEKH